MEAIEILEAEIRSQGSQNKVSEDMKKKGCKVSPTKLSLYRKGEYPYPEKVEEDILTCYGKKYEQGDTLECPAIGEIHRDVCKRYREAVLHGRKMSTQMYSIVKNHCKTCTHYVD